MVPDPDRIYEIYSHRKQKQSTSTDLVNDSERLFEIKTWRCSLFSFKNLNLLAITSKVLLKIIYSTFHTFLITFNFEKTNKAVIIAAVWMKSRTPASTHPTTFTLSCREHHGLLKKLQSFRNIVSQQNPGFSPCTPLLLILGRTSKFTPRQGTRRGGGGGGGTSLGFSLCYSILKRFHLK